MKTNDKPQLHPYDISPEVMAFSTTRHGGVSTGMHADFNINVRCGDTPENIAANRNLICNLLGIDDDHLIIPNHQKHDVEVRQIAPEFFKVPETVRHMLLDGIDSVMTNMQGVFVGVSTADCIPVLLYDTRNKACCAVHAGWKGTAKRAVEKALLSMYLAYDTEASDVKAVIGPGISLKNFEVGDEVYEIFAANNFDMERISRHYEKWHIDLWECNRLQLIESGVPESNIRVDGICTYDNTDDFFSARRMGKMSGRILSGMIIK